MTIDPALVSIIVAIVVNAPAFLALRSANSKARAEAANSDATRARIEDEITERVLTRARQEMDALRGELSAEREARKRLEGELRAEREARGLLEHKLTEANQRIAALEDENDRLRAGRPRSGFGAK